MKMHAAVLCVLAAGLCLAAPAVRADDGADQAAYESFKESYDSFKGVYDKTKGVVDSTAEFFGKFSDAVSTWRNACSKEFQDAGIEGITELTKEQLGAIDSLAETLSEATGISIPESIPEGIKSKISSKILDSLPQDKKAKFGYMYSLSAADRKMRESGTYQRLMDVKEKFEAGSELLGNIDNAVEFIDTFNPKTDGSVTGSLKKIKGVLDYMGGFTEGIPLMGEIIKGYADVTEGFVGALEDLDKKLKESRQGSLGGQLGVDVEVKKKILAEYPGIEGEMTLYFSINGEYPELKPIRGWKNDMVLLYHGSDSGDGTVALMHGGSFGILYRYYAALKHSEIEGAKKLADPELFMGRARAIGDRDISESDRKFRGYYALFEGPSSMEFLNVLDAAGKRGEGGMLVSESGRVTEYRLYSKKEDEFAGLCFFSHQFRADVEGLIAKYGEMFALNASVKAADGRKLEGLEILLNGAPPAKTTERNNRVSFQAVFKKGETYRIDVKAAGMKPYSKSGLNAAYITVELEPESDGGGAFRIIAPDTAETATAFQYSVDLGSTALKAGQTVRWFVPGTIIGDGMSGNYTPSSPGTLKLSAQIITAEEKGGTSYGRPVSKDITIVPPVDFGIKITFDAPADVLVAGGQVPVTVTVDGSKPVFGSVSYSLREETTGTELIKPTSWAYESKPGWQHKLSARFDVPKKPSVCVFVYEVPHQVKGSSTTVIASARHTMTVHSMNLQAPSSVNAQDIFPVSVTVPGPLSGKVKAFSWYPYDAVISGSEWGRTTAPSVNMQPRNDHIREGGTIEISCSMIGEKGEVLGQENKVIAIRPVKIGTAVPGSWEGGFPNFKRKTAVRMRPDNGKEVQSASVNAWVKVVMDRPTSVFYKEEDARKSVAAWAAQNGAQTREITIGNFKGTIAEKPLKSRYGGNPWGYVDVGTVRASAEGKGMLFNGAFTMTIDYGMGGEGLTLGSDTIWWDDMPFVVQQTEQAIAEAQGIIAGIQITPDASMTKAAEEKPKAQPKVTLTASRKTLRKGESAEVAAVVENAEPADQPFAYTWSGNYAGKGDKVTFLASQPGKQSLSVAVKGARYGLGSASIEFTVEDVSVKITKDSPAGSSIVAGTEASFTAQATVGGKTASGIVFHWQPHPEVAFTPFEGSEGKTKARFTRTGKVKVWVEALEQKGGTLATLGSSDQIELDIVKPELKLTLAPQGPLVGQEIKAEVSSTASLAEADLKWELSSNAHMVNESQDSKSIVFFAKDDKPVTVVCRARVKQYGDELGEAKATVTAKPYKVKVDVLGPIGPAPRVWKPGQGLVEEKSAIATFQNVRVKVSMDPAPSKTPRYKWTLNEDSHFAGGQSGNEITVNRSRKGECTASVEVTDPDGLMLGKGSASFSVTVSEDDVKNAGKKKEAADDLAKAKEMVPKGMMDEALVLLAGAAKKDPDNREIAAFSAKTGSDRDKILDYLGKAKEHLAQSRVKEAAAEHGFAEYINAKYPPVVEMKTALEAATKKAAEDAAKKAEKPESKTEKKEKPEPEKQAGAGKGTPAVPAAPITGTDAKPGAGEKKPADDPAAKAAALALQGDGLYQEYRAHSAKGGIPEKSIELLTAAARKYKESIAERANPEVRKKLENADALRAELEQALKNTARAGDIRKEADKLAQKKKFRDAIAKYEEAMKLHAFPDKAAIMDTVANLKIMAANEEADAIRSEGEKLEKKGSLKEAAAKYDEALKIYHPSSPSRKELEAHVRKVREIIAAASALIKSGEAKEKKNQLAEAAADYEKSLGLLADPELKARVEELKKRLASLQKEGDRLKAQGEKLEAAGSLSEALAKYAEALAAYHPSSAGRKELDTHAAALKASIAKAGALRKQGELKEKKKQTAAAIADYEASLALVKDPALEAHVKELKAAAAAKPLSGTKTGAVSPASGGEEAVRQMYAEFARAYGAKNEARVMGFIAGEWSAGDGTSASDLRNYLHNSFTVFDEIRYTVSNLRIRKINANTYGASYDIAITGKIYENNIRHDEKSSVEEQVAVDAKGRAKILKTSAGKFWYVE